MCKKDIFKQLKNITKAIPNNLNNIKQSTAQQLKNVSQKVDINQVFKKTKQQLDSKQKILQSYTNKAKQVAGSTADQLLKNSQKIINTTAEYKNKVLDEKNLSKHKENLQQLGQKLKEKIQQGKKIIEQKTQDLLKTKQEQNNKNSKYTNFSYNKISQFLFKKGQKQVFSGFPNKVFGDMFSSLYWRLIFALCLFGFIMVSPQFLKHGGQLWLNHKRLQSEKDQQKKLSESKIETISK